MTKASWRRKIRKACESAGTYEQFFEATIDTLAGILATRDAAEKRFKEEGSHAVVKYTNKSGVENLIKNPVLVVIMECNTQALAFWRDLGLTPSGLKRIRDKGAEKSVKSDKQTVLDAIRSRHAV